MKDYSSEGVLPKINEKYLITTDAWFIAPDGYQYQAVFGTVHSVANDETILGIKTNRGSSNWYVVIGDMIVAGCQIHYCIRCDEISKGPSYRQIEHNGELKTQRENHTKIYLAD